MEEMMRSDVSLSSGPCLSKLSRGNAGDGASHGDDIVDKTSRHRTAKVLRRAMVAGTMTGLSLSYL